MPKIILTRGIPASGKSTWAKEWVAEDPVNRLRVNRDNLRWTLGIKKGVGTHEQEEEVTFWQREMVSRAIAQGKDVVVDDTNLRAKYAKEWLSLAAAFGVPVEFKDFPINLEEALYRDNWRRYQGERFAGEAVVTDFYNRYTPKGKMPAEPRLPEGEQPNLKFAPYKPTPGLPWAIIVDIDGTLAHMNGRGPYETEKYATDEFDITISNLIDAWVELMGGHVIVMSGRDEQYRTVTEKWLRRHDRTWDHFYMRAVGDTRNDAVVKNELFEKYVAGHYNIDFVLDDRNRVVAMWRAKGLRVLQVAEGDF